MATLRNIRKSFVSGRVIDYGSYLDSPTCIEAAPATSYSLAYAGVYYRHRIENVSCSGVIINTQGYDTFELNTYGVWSGISWGSWPYATWYDFTIYVGESDTPDGVFTLIYQSDTQNYASIPITKNYLKFWATLSKRGADIYWGGEVGLIQPSELHNISINVKTPQKHPAYNAMVNIIDADDNGAITTAVTDTNGNAIASVDIIDHPNIKLWAEKSINKSILNMTAKGLSDLLEINVDG